MNLSSSFFRADNPVSFKKSLIICIVKELQKYSLSFLSIYHFFIIVSHAASFMILVRLYQSCTILYNSCSARFGTFFSPLHTKVFVKSVKQLSITLHHANPKSHQFVSPPIPSNLHVLNSFLLSERLN